MNLTLVKLGGELLEDKARLTTMARALARVATPLVVVHGGGREIDAALASAGIAKRQVDGLRITDVPTLDIVVAVLAGTINTRFVAAINASGGRAVGLTGADADVAPVRKARPFRATNGETVDLGLVGEPTGNTPPALIRTLTSRGFVPVIACIGASKSGELFNVNADTLAGSLAARLGVTRLVIAGGTAGVLDADGATVPSLNARDVRALVKAGTVNAGMVAKLAACLTAARRGVRDVRIVSGHDVGALRRVLEAPARTKGQEPGTRVTP